MAIAKAANCYASCKEEIGKLTEEYAFHLQNRSTDSFDENPARLKEVDFDINAHLRHLRYF